MSHDPIQPISRGSFTSHDPIQLISRESFMSHDPIKLMRKGKFMSHEPNPPTRIGISYNMTLPKKQERYIHVT
jgi:hypothetical protein